MIGKILLFTSLWIIIGLIIFRVCNDAKRDGWWLHDEDPE